MVRKICPICDQVMKTSHFCTNCRSWVKHPYVREVNYYLNERHPENEAACSYHGVGETDHGKHGQTQKSGGGWIPAAGRPVKQPWMSSVGRSQTADTPRNGRPSRKFLILFVILWLLLALAGNILPLLRKALTHFDDSPGYSQLAPEPDTGWEQGLEEGQEEDEADGFVETELREAREDAVQAAGERCNSDDHFPVVLSDLEEPVRQALEHNGYKIEETESYSTNYEAVRSDGEVEYTYYNRYVTFWIQSEGENYPYVELNCDTATEELHSIDFWLQDEDPAIGEDSAIGEDPVIGEENPAIGKVDPVIDLTEEILDILAEQGAFSMSLDYGEQVRQEMPECIQEDGSYWMETDELWFGADLQDGMYRISIDRM